MNAKGHAIVLSSAIFVLLLSGDQVQAGQGYPASREYDYRVEQDSVRVILRTEHRSPDSLSILVDIQSPAYLGGFQMNLFVDTTRIDRVRFEEKDGVAPLNLLMNAGTGGAVAAGFPFVKVASDSGDSVYFDTGPLQPGLYTFARIVIHTTEPIGPDDISFVPLFADTLGLAVPNEIVSDLGSEVATSPLRDPPTRYRLFQNYPNPFNSQTLVGYNVPQKSRVRIDVYNVLGERVATLVDESQETGHYVVRWDGSHLASGVYFVRLRSGDVVKKISTLLQR